MFIDRFPKSRTILFRALGLLLPLLACSLPLHCHAAQEPDPKLIEQRAITIMKDIIDGVSEGDYNLYVKDFSDVMKKATDREKFLTLQGNLRRNVGKFKSFKYIGFYVQEGFVITLFKARFTKEKDDVLVNLVLDRRTEPKVTGLWFDAPSLRTK